MMFKLQRHLYIIAIIDDLINLIDDWRLWENYNR